MQEKSIQDKILQAAFCAICWIPCLATQDRLDCSYLDPLVAGPRALLGGEEGIECNLDLCLFQTVPYTGNISGGLGAKRTIVVRGSIPMNSNRFHIDLTAGQDIALHINPRMQERTVVRNSFLNGSWGPEERELPFNPFQPGQYFELSIRCGNHRFKVYVNGQPFFNYAHRYRNFPQINTLQIDGDVVLSYIQC